jgi:hypothetical protein
MSNFKFKAMLPCGTWIEIVQPGESQTLEMTISPAEGKKIEDTAWFKDGNLRINATISTLSGMREVLRLIFRKPPRKFFGIF